MKKTKEKYITRKQLSHKLHVTVQALKYREENKLPPYQYKYNNQGCIMYADNITPRDYLKYWALPFSANVPLKRLTQQGLLKVFDESVITLHKLNKLMTVLLQAFGPEEQEYNAKYFYHAESCTIAIKHILEIIEYYSSKLEKIKDRTRVKTFNFRLGPKHLRAKK